MDPTKDSVSQPHRGHSFWKVLQILVTLGVCAWLIAVAPWGDLLQVLQRIHWLPLALAIMLGPVLLLLRALRWFVLLPSAGDQRTVLSLFRVVWIGDFVSSFLPSTVGGDVYRVVAVSQQVGARISTASVVLDRLMGFSMIVLGAAVGLLISPAFRSLPGMVPGALVATALLLAIGLLLFIGPWWQRPAKRTSKQPRGTLRAWMGKVHDGILTLASYRDKPSVMRNAVVVSVFIGLCPVASTWLVLQAVSANVGLSELVAPVFGSMLVATLPIFIGGLGGREGSFVVLMSVIGMPIELSGSAALVGRVLAMLLSLVGAAFYLFRSPSAR